MWWEKIKAGGGGAPLLRATRPLKEDEAVQVDPVPETLLVTAHLKTTLWSYRAIQQTEHIQGIKQERAAGCVSTSFVHTHL